MNVLGYSDRLSARPGDTVRFMVSTTESTYDAALVRLARPFLDPDPASDIEIDSDFTGTHPGRWQGVPIGSYACFDMGHALDRAESLTIQTWIYPQLVRGQTEQGILSNWSEQSADGFWFGLNNDGRLEFRIGGGRGSFRQVATSARFITRQWYFVTAMADRQSMALELMPIHSWLQAEPGSVSVPGGSLGPARNLPLLIGASMLEEIDGGRMAPRGNFNGKIDRPRIWTRRLSLEERERLRNGADPLSFADGLLAAWDLSRSISSERIVDLSPNALHGITVNGPMRGVTGANWNGSDISFHVVPEQYGAIAFHQDDLTDCRWAVDFEHRIPKEARSGIYAARLQAGDSVDYVPFYVRSRSGPPSASILYLAPTNTYLAYGNEKLFRGIESAPDLVELMPNRLIELSSRDRYLLSRPDLGASAYDVHPDGTGICFSTRLRPLLTMRPDFISWPTGCFRHFSADLYLIQWLERFGYDFDVATDEDLHLEGVDALRPYAVVVTGSHPEYWTAGMLDALETYLAQGGRMIYLGGNGFYWVIGIGDENPHLIEVRRGVNGTRSWTSGPGESYLSSTGEPGGLWRDRGRPPNRITGVGFTAQGWSAGKGYRRLPASFDERCSFIFEGVSDDGLIGVAGLIMGGASGDEIDRHDPALGSPSGSVILATSQGEHDDCYQLVIEDLTAIVPGHGGNQDPRVRADLTYSEFGRGATIFSTGSINWIGSLMVEDGQNDVSRITRNVLNRFSQR